jgi:F-type H+-transporting ATPase subunit delta
MSLRTSANRYAKALFDVALQEKADVKKIDQDLTAVAETFASNSDVLLVARRTGLPMEKRMALVTTIADQLGLTPQVRKLLVMLTERQGLELVPDLVEAYRERLLDHLNIVRGEVATAAPLSPEKTKALQDRLSQATGKNVELSVRVDPSLIGGVVARIGSTVYDGSVRTQLKRLRAELTEQK